MNNGYFTFLKSIKLKKADLIWRLLFEEIATSLTMSWKYWTTTNNEWEYEWQAESVGDAATEKKKKIGEIESSKLLVFWLDICLNNTRKHTEKEMWK